MFEVNKKTNLLINTEKNHQHAGVPHEWIEWHGHNNFYRAVANSTAAWLYGCSSVNCSLFGIGERTGNTPLVTRAGIHADGLLKNKEIYNIFDTDKLLKRLVRVAVSNTSGLAGIAHWISSNPRYAKLKGIDKNDPLCMSIKAWVDDEYAGGRTTVISDDELDNYIDHYLEDQK